MKTIPLFHSFKKQIGIFFFKKKGWQRLSPAKPASVQPSDEEERGFPPDALLLRLPSASA